jgi:glycine/serine hydroxymethyltransferase
MPIIEVKDTVNGEEVSIYIEVDNLPIAKSPYEDVRSGESTKVVTAAADVFGEAMKLTRSFAKRVVDNVKQMEETIRPEEFEVKLGIKLDSEIGAVIAKASTGAQIEVVMKWKPRSQL